jgi:hypothetical protein
MARLKLFARDHVRLLLVLGIMLTGVTVFALTADRSPIGDRATAWAVGHSSSLPQTLEELAAYPPVYRREIVKALPPETKSALWRAQLRRFVADRPNLTVGQREFMSYAIDVASPEAFAPGANPPELCERIAKMFPNAEDRAQFRLIAEGVAPTFAWRPAVITLTERVRERVFASAQAEECNCRGLGLCECSLLEGCSPLDCTPADNCGCVFVGSCNRVCEFMLSER